MISYELTFVKNLNSACSLSLFYLWCPVVPSLFVKKVIFAPLCCLCSSVKDQWIIFMWVYSWALYPSPLIYMSVLLWYHAILIILALQKILMLDVVNPLILFFSNILLAHLGFLPFHSKFRLSLLVSTK